MTCYGANALFSNNDSNVRRNSVNVTRLAAIALLCFCTVATHARPASYFGFGNPPSYLDVLDRLGGHLAGVASLDESLRSLMAVTLPEAGCLDRGAIRRAVCGYRLCGSFQGGAPREFWITNGFGAWDLGPSSYCPAVLTPETGWKGDPVVATPEFCDIHPKHEECPAKKEGLVPLTLHQSTGAERLEREASLRAEAIRTREESERQTREAERLKRDAERLKREGELRKAMLMAEDRAARRAMAIDTATGRGPIAVYTALASVVYADCRRYADHVFTIDTKPTALDIAGFEACAKEAQEALQQHVRAAIAATRSQATSELIKDLHAYAIASLRALDNYRQSIIEARQDRSARMAGIDQRVARIELELP